MTRREPTPLAVAIDLRIVREALGRERYLEALEWLQGLAEDRLATASARLGVPLAGLTEGAKLSALMEVSASPEISGAERHAYELFKWCAYARSGNPDDGRADLVHDRLVAHYTGMVQSDLIDAGARAGHAQRARRKGKPAADPADTSRDERLRAFHERLSASGASNATSATAVEFGLSTRRVRQILRG